MMRKIIRLQSGFTLIEMLIVVAIVGILTAIALPSYQDSIQKSRRSDATIALERAAAMEEQHFFASNVYSNSVNDIGGSGGSLISPEGNYAITAAVVGTAFTLTATALTSSPQWDDTDCRSFTLNNTGARASRDSGAAVTTNCW